MTVSERLPVDRRQRCSNDASFCTPERQLCLLLKGGAHHEIFHLREVLAFQQSGK